MFGNVKEYRVIEITKKVLEKKKWSLEEFDKESLDKIDEILDNDGLIFALGRKVDKKKIIKGLYLFNKQTKDDEIIIVFDKTIFVEDIRDEVIFEFEDAIDSFLGAAVSEKKVKKAYFKDKEYEVKIVKIGKYEVSATILWILWGAITWILTQDVFWLCLGVIFGTTCGYVVKVNGKVISVKKSKNKKKKNNKKKAIKK